MRSLRHCTAPILLLWLCACHAAAPEPVHVPPQLERYADACAFVSDGMLSFAFSDLRWLRDEDSAPGSGLWVVAGRDFRSKSALSSGAGSLVMIHDAGRGSTTDAASVLGETGLLVGACVGLPCFFVPALTRRDDPCWYAVVGERFVVCASSRGMLATALHRRGSLAGILAAFDPLPTLPEQSACTILNLPRPGGVEVWGDDVPDQPTVSVLVAEPWRLRTLARTPLRPFYRDRIFWQSDVVEITDGAWRGLECPRAQAEYRILQMAMLFGEFIFI